MCSHPLQGEGFIIATIPFGPSPLMAEVRTVQPSAYWAEVGISNPCQQALIAAVAGDDWSEGLNGVGHGTMIAFLSSHPSITSPKQVGSGWAARAQVANGASMQVGYAGATGCAGVRRLSACVPPCTLCAGAPNLFHSLRPAAAV